MPQGCFYRTARGAVLFNLIGTPSTRASKRSICENPAWDGVVRMTTTVVATTMTVEPSSAPASSAPTASPTHLQLLLGQIATASSTRFGIAAMTDGFTPGDGSRDGTSYFQSHFAGPHWVEVQLKSPT